MTGAAVLLLELQAESAARATVMRKIPHGSKEPVETALPFFLDIEFSISPAE